MLRNDQAPMRLGRPLASAWVACILLASPACQVGAPRSRGEPVAPHTVAPGSSDGSSPPETTESAREPREDDARARCEPLPREGDACEESGFCVLTWGEPGGHSSALWCRDGYWVVEEELNLP